MLNLQAGMEVHLFYSSDIESSGSDYQRSMSKMKTMFGHSFSLRI